MPQTAGKYGSKDQLTPSGEQKVASTRHQEELAMIQGQIAQDIYNQTQGLRDLGTGQLTRFLRTGESPAAISPVFGQLYREGRQDLEDQYKVARQQILNETPSQGGQLNQQLANLAMNRARAASGLRTSIEAPLREQLFQGALGIGYGQPPIALSGLSSAGSQFGQVAARSQAEQLEREARSKEELQQVGSMVGMAFG